MIDTLATTRAPRFTHRKGGSPAAKRRRQTVENRRAIRRAFDIVRHDPTEKAVRDRLLGALAGRVEITDTFMEMARQIISDHRRGQQ